MVDKFSWLQLQQAKALVMVGWQLFDRPQDFTEFQICDFVRLEGATQVWVRRAKNDRKGMTRSAMLKKGGNPAECPEALFWSYAKAAGIRVNKECTKVQGKPDRCPH